MLHERNDSMILLSIGYNHLHNTDFVVDRPTGIDSYLFLLVKSNAIFRHGGVEYKVKANSFVIFESSYPHFYCADNEEYVDDWFHFFADEDDLRLFKKLNIPLNKIIALDDITPLTSIIRKLTYEFYAENIHKSEVVALEYQLLFYKLSQVLSHNKAYDDSMKSAYYVRMQALRNDIYNNPHIERTVDSMAEKLSMSRSSFQHNYKKLFGKSVTSDIINSRITKVKFYLTTTSMTIEEIAYQTGYNSPLHLIRQFKQYCDITPSEYRNCR